MLTCKGNIFTIGVPLSIDSLGNGGSVSMETSGIACGIPAAIGVSTSVGSGVVPVVSWSVPMNRRIDALIYST